jgi:hypothetical protein
MHFPTAQGRLQELFGVCDTQGYDLSDHCRDLLHNILHNKQRSISSAFGAAMAQSN